MKKVLLAIALLVLSLFTTITVNAQDKLFKVLSVVDGDTIIVDVRGKKETVRLLGIDAPETKDPRKPVQCFGQAAKDKMKSFVLGKSVILIDDSTQGNRDKYKRLLRYVYLNDSKRTFVNGEMVKQGYAFSYKEYPTKMLGKFSDFEKYARENKLGLWGSCSLSSPTTTKKSVLPTSKPKTLTNPNTSTVKSTTPYVSNLDSSDSEADKDCRDFNTQAEAQAFFISHGGPSSDPHRLDSDHDGRACENLP